jgi:membrane-associated phospholipid phosphatase
LSKASGAVRAVRRALTSSDRESRALRRYLLNLALGAIAIIVVLGPMGLLVEQLTSDRDFRSFDLSPAKDMHPVVRHSPGIVDALEVVSFFGSPPWFYALIGASVIYLWRKQRRMLATFMVLSGLLGGVVDTAVKLWVDRPRPTLPHPVALGPHGSFPSGHVMTATIGYGLILLVFLPPIARLSRALAFLGAFLFVCVIGFARLALGVHFLSDVVGGFVLGAAWLSASVISFNNWRRERSDASNRLAL